MSRLMKSNDQEEKKNKIKVSKISIITTINF